MRLDRNLLIGAASALAISALPPNLESAALGSFQLSSAYAKGGNGGGRIVAEGTPEDVAKVETSHTGRYLKRLLK